MLSLFGLAMAFATVFVISPKVEPVIWPVIFVIYACAIAAKSRARGYFAHGLLLGLVNSVWITTAHILFFDRYIAGHPQEAAMMKGIPLAVAPKLMMAIVGLWVGLISGALIGLLALVAGKVLRRPKAPAYE